MQMLKYMTAKRYLSHLMHLKENIYNIFTIVDHIFYGTLKTWIQRHVRYLFEMSKMINLYWQLYLNIQCLWNAAKQVPSCLWLSLYCVMSGNQQHNGKWHGMQIRLGNLAVPSQKTALQVPSKQIFSGRRRHPCVLPSWWYMYIKQIKYVWNVKE